MTAVRFYALADKGRCLWGDPGRVSGLLAKLQGKRLWITIEPARSRRTMSQNRYLHGVIFPAISEWSGHTATEVKDALKWMFLRKTVNLPTGEEVETVRSTAELTVEEFTTFVDQCSAWAAESGCPIPTREEISA